MGDTHVTLIRTGVLPVDFKTADRWYRAHLSVMDVSDATGCRTSPAESLGANIDGQRIQFSLTALSAGSTSVVIAARATVSPSRPSSSMLPSDVLGAKVSYINMNRKKLNFTATLSTFINALPMDTGALHTCPASASQLTVLFQAPDGGREVRDTRCYGVTVGSTVLAGGLDEELAKLGVQIP